jgi:penicillin G amidase
VSPTLDPNRTGAKAARGTAVIIGLFVLTLGAVIFGGWWIRRSLPPLDGRLPLIGLRSPVNVRFDAFAVPHVFAGSDEDAWRAVGYLQARDRLWQMELYRRAASGRLSELLGEATVAVDRRFLVLGLRRAAEIEWRRMTPRARLAFENYAGGVNAAMNVARGDLPLEHQLLGLRPEPWTPIDSLAIGKLFAWRLGENHRAELLRYELVGELGPRALELFPGPPEWAPTILGARGAMGARSLQPARPEKGALGARGVPRLPRPPSFAEIPRTPARPRRSFAEAGRSAEGAKAGRWTMDDRRSTIDYPPGLEWLSPDSTAMSNSWVVHGSRTATRRPILANDPHLAIEMPSVWWEVHVVAATLNVAGVTIPGTPFVIIGHNARVAWGLTNVGADVQDFFLEQLDGSRERYRSGDQWLPLTVNRHRIRVRGHRDPVAFEVRSTRHGAILNADDWRELQPGERHEPRSLDDTVLALKWDAIMQGESAVAFDALSRAGNWNEFVSAVRKFSVPAQHFVYADIDGNIGYAMSGLLPVRNGPNEATPAPGWLVEADWRGMVDVNQLPAVFNPASGMIVTANNEVDRKLPFLLTSDWVAPFRAQRITTLLEGANHVDVEAMTRMQADITSMSADWILRHVEVPEDVQELSAWDRRVDERPVAAVFEAFEEALWRLTFADEMSPSLYERFYRYAANERFAGLHSIVAEADSPWFDDRRTRDVVEKRRDIARQAGSVAVSSLRARFGDRSFWRWNEIHSAKFSHALAGGGRLLDWFFSRGPVPVAGDSMTVNKATTNLRRPYETSEAASYRQVLDVGAWDRSVAVNTTGQSGHPQSPHYFDQNRLWRQGRYRALTFTREAIERATVSTLELIP